MKELVINQIAPIVATAIVAILVTILNKVGDAAIEFCVTKKKEVEQAIVASGHEEELKTAKEVWNIVEEKYRITENALSILGSKVDYFDKILLQKIPGLTQQNSDDLRQAIAGEFNKGKAAVGADAKVQLQQANATIDKMQAENTDLKTKLNQMNNIINPTQEAVQA